jgi:hypothetical protein
MNNPPAFPTCIHVTKETVARGMTLRDYFAAHALIALMSGPDRIKNKEDILELAPASFALADAMLKEREQ